MAIREILLLGNPCLYETSFPVRFGERTNLTAIVSDLHDTLMCFRERYGIGRAIAAPQIGVKKRLIYVNINGPIVFINPVLRDMSKETITVWDDCMCFPDLLVKVSRHRACTIFYRDAEWTERQMKLENDLSELLQHEYDHLDGILAVERAVDAHAFAFRSQRERLSESA